MVAWVRLEQPVNADEPILVTDSGIIMDVKPEPEKVDSSIVSIELGKVIEVRLEQPVNADEPILVTELGIITDVSSSQPLNADEPILVTELGILMDVILV